MKLINSAHLCAFLIGGLRVHFRKRETKAGVVWEAIAHVGHDPVTGKRKQVARRGKTKKEAKERIEKYLRSIQDYGIDENLAKKITFEKIAQEWLKSYEMEGKKKNSIRIRKREIKTLNGYMAKKPIGMISHNFYQSVIYELSKKLERTTVQGINTCAGMIFRFAKKNNLLRDSPNADVVIPKKRKSVDEVRYDKVADKYLEHEELQEFFDVLLKHGLKHDKERFYVLAFSGMRSGELCALKKQDLDFKENTIDINKTIYNEKNNMKEYELTPPKTEGSIRVVTMDKPIMEMLKRVVRSNDEHKMQYRTILDDYHDEDFLFSRPNGYPFAQKNLLVRMNRLMDKTNIKKHATPHIFRHTHISMLAEAGVDLPTIMQRVGHEDIDTTMQIYTHVTNKMKKDATTKIENLYGNILEKAEIQ